MSSQCNDFKFKLFLIISFCLSNVVYLDLSERDIILIIMGVSQADIELAEEVRKYPALYDKKFIDFHKEDVVSNCWERVHLILGLETPATARKGFELLRKLFNSVRKKKLGAGRSGTSRQEMLTQIGDVDGYEFRTYIRRR